MSRIGVISNPRSRQNLRGMDGLRAFIAAGPGILHRELAVRADTAVALRDFAEAGVDILVVSGGDGTVHSVLTDILNGAWPSAPPRIAVLPSGTTNLIAADVGLAGDPVEALRRLAGRIAAGQAVAEERRAIVSIRYAPDAMPIHGMFFGTAAFYRGTLLGRREIHPLGVDRSLFAGFALFWFLLRAFFSRTGRNPLYRGEPMEVRIDGRALPEPEQFVLLGTTLHRLILKLMPFWGGGPGALRYTSVGFPPKRLARALVPLLRGTPRPWMAAEGYHSGRAGEMTLVTDCPIVMDGEIFPTSKAVPVVIRADHEVTFVRA